MEAPWPGTRRQQLPRRRRRRPYGVSAYPARRRRPPPAWPRLPQAEELQPRPQGLRGGHQPRRGQRDQLEPRRHLLDHYRPGRQGSGATAEGSAAESEVQGSVPEHRPGTQGARQLRRGECFLRQGADARRELPPGVPPPRRCQAQLWPSLRSTGRLQDGGQAPARVCRGAAHGGRHATRPGPAGGGGGILHSLPADGAQGPRQHRACRLQQDRLQVSLAAPGRPVEELQLRLRDGPLL
mmetsp:Transcript_18565/g.71653  ORF Transcript_18565/g.71653 Transcript_18565/m.71653 type:complete len:239 (+) Transcript_18565:620-1336(+)